MTEKVARNMWIRFGGVVWVSPDVILLLPWTYDEQWELKGARVMLPDVD